LIYTACKSSAPMIFGASPKKTYRDQFKKKSRSSLSARSSRTGTPPPPPPRRAPLLHGVAPAQHERRHPQREPHDHEPEALEQHGRGTHHRHREAPRQDGAGGGGDEGRRHRELQQPVVVVLEPRVVRGVEPKQEQLLPEHRRGERGHHVPNSQHPRRGARRRRRRSAIDA
jgi:hypothetical protein